MPRHGQPGAHNCGTVIDRTRVEQLRHLDEQGDLGAWAHDVLFDGDGLLNGEVVRRLLADLGARKVQRRTKAGVR